MAQVGAPVSLARPSSWNLKFDVLIFSPNSDGVPAGKLRDSSTAPIPEHYADHEHP